MLDFEEFVNTGKSIELRELYAFLRFKFFEWCSTEEDYDIQALCRQLEDKNLNTFACHRHLVSVTHKGKPHIEDVDAYTRWHTYRGFNITVTETRSTGNEHALDLSSLIENKTNILAARLIRYCECCFTSDTTVILRMLKDNNVDKLETICLEKNGTTTRYMGYGFYRSYNTETSFFSQPEYTEFGFMHANPQNSLLDVCTVISAPSEQLATALYYHIHPNFTDDHVTSGPWEDLCEQYPGLIVHEKYTLSYKEDEPIF